MDGNRKISPCLGKIRNLFRTDSPEIIYSVHCGQAKTLSCPAARTPYRTYKEFSVRAERMGFVGGGSREEMCMLKGY